jgi:hypothetical protein
MKYFSTIIISAVVALAVAHIAPFGNKNASITPPQ